jgi:ABC-2 type transport system ATP-binding protein
LLTTLDIETFIFDLDKQPSDELLKLLDAEITEDNSIQLDVHKSQALNDVFKAIDSQDYKVLSMRNKVNRLEELFFKMTHQTEKDQNDTEDTA